MRRRNDHEPARNPPPLSRLRRIHRSSNGAAAVVNLSDKQMKTLPKVLLSRTAPSDWETSRLALEGSFYLSEAYAGVLAAQGCEPVFLVWRNETQVQGMALGFLTDQWRGWPIRLFVRNFRWQTHPVVRGRDHDRWTDFVKAILKRVESLRVMAITLGSEDARENPEVGDFSDFTAIRRWEFRVALDADPAMVLGRIAARKRTYLRAALKASQLIVREMRDVESVRRLIDFQHVSRERRRARGEDYEVATARSAEMIFENYVKKGYGRVFCSFRDNRPLSGVLLHCDGRSAYYTMSGCSAEGFQSNAPLITVWKAIEMLCSDGYRELNMGGVGASASDPADIGHGLYRFKRSFGGSEVACVSLEREVPGIQAYLARRFVEAR